MNILAVETSCDETALAIVRADGGLQNPHFEIVGELVSSQIDVHKEFGGVVPTLAKREHLKNLPVLYKKLFKTSPVGIEEIDMIAVTVGPGLEPALWTGINEAQRIGKEHDIPIVGVNHMHGHMYSFLLSGNIKTADVFPMVALLVSGGHTIIISMDSLQNYRVLGETRDDAVGESFDKVARLLGIPYPGGPAIEKLADKGDSHAIAFPSPMLHEKGYDTSFSGLKTAVLYYMREQDANTQINANQQMTANKKEKMWKMGEYKLSDKERANIAASFQYAAFNALTRKTARAAKNIGARAVTIGGGVSANKKLHKILLKRLDEDGCSDVKIITPPINYCMDNAAMIGVAGYITSLRGLSYPLEADGVLGV